MKIRNGITVRGGSEAFVMPTKCLPGTPIQESPGSRRCQTFVGAIGWTAAHSGQTERNVLTGDGKGRRFNMPWGDVNMCLGSAVGMTDAVNAASVSHKLSLGCAR